MITYISKKDNTTLIKLVEFNEKFKTYTVEFLNGNKKGKQLSYCSSTIKRWWKKCDVDFTKVKESKPEVINKIAPVEDGHSVKNEKSENKKNNIDLILSHIIDSLSEYIQVPYKTNRNYLTIKTNTEKPKRLAEVDVLCKKVTVYMREKVDNLPEGISFHKFVNNTLGNCYHVSYDCDYIKNIRYLLDFQKEALI